MTVPNPAQPRTYPLSPDGRFTLGLVFAVAKVLAGHGFPEITSGGDLVALQQALYGFVYVTPVPTGGGVILGHLDLEGEPLADRLAEGDGRPVSPHVEGHSQTGRGRRGGAR